MVSLLQICQNRANLRSFTRSLAFRLAIRLWKRSACLRRTEAHSCRGTRYRGDFGVTGRRYWSDDCFSWAFGSRGHREGAKQDGATQRRSIDCPFCGRWRAVFGRRRLVCGRQHCSTYRSPGKVGKAIGRGSWPQLLANSPYFTKRCTFTADALEKPASTEISEPKGCWKPKAERRTEEKG